jgi:hypothetical protein
MLELEPAELAEPTDCRFTVPDLSDLLLDELVDPSSCDDIDRSLISDDSDVMELLRRDRDLEAVFISSEISEAPAPSTAHPALPPSCREIIFMPIVRPVLAGINSVVQPFCRVIAVLSGW